MRLALLVWAMLALWGAACEREFTDHAPPLRPLVYTEANPEEADASDGGVALPQYAAPQDLGVAVYQSLVDHDRALFEHVFVSGQELVDLIRTPSEQAEVQAAELLTDSDPTWQLFSMPSASVAPVGGVRSRLQLLEFSIGKGRNLRGKIVRPGDPEIVQHWGNELRLQLRDTEKIFSLRVPKIVRTSHGWKLARDVDADPTLRMFLESGMHLKPELLSNEHFAYPLEVGNFWKYRVDYFGMRPPAPPRPVVEHDERDASDAAPTPSELLDDTYGEVTVRISVTEIARREGYLIAGFKREVQGPVPDEETYRRLVTPRQIYPCTRDCWAHIDDVGYLLGYMSQQIPLFVFPLQPGTGWGKAGRSSEHDRYEVQPELEPQTMVPAGDFSDTIIIVGSVEEGREERFFIPGTGIIKRKVRSGLGPRMEELIEYRLML